MPFDKRRANGMSSCAMETTIILIVRRGLVARRARLVGPAVLQPFVQQAQLLLQGVDLVLLADNDLVQCLEQVFGKSELGFEFGEARVTHGCLVWGCLGSLCFFCCGFCCCLVSLC